LKKYQEGERVRSKRWVGAEIEAEAKADTLNLNSLLPSCVGIGGDGSLQNGVEVRTPPASGIRFEELIGNTCKGLKEAHYGVGRRCGLHIHLNAPDYRRNGKLVVRLWRFARLFEPVIYLMVSPSRLDNNFCFPIRSMKKQARNWYGRKSGHMARLPGYGEGQKSFDTSFYNNEVGRKKSHGFAFRYCGSNLHSIYFRGTLEVRYHNGTLDPRKIIEWSILWQSILDSTKKISDGQVRAYGSLPLEKRIDGLFDLIGNDQENRDYLWTRIRKFNNFERVRKLL